MRSGSISRQALISACASAATGLLASGAVSTNRAAVAALTTSSSNCTAVAVSSAGPTNALTFFKPVIVQASRTGRTSNQMAARVTTVSADQIAASGVKDVTQALEKLGGIYFRRLNGHPIGQEAVMGGFGENAHGRVLVLVDGQRLNEPDMANPNWARVPVSSIQSIEILHGPQTALYGNYAVAGVINIRTKRVSTPETTVTATVGSQDTYGAHVRHAGSIGEDTYYSADVDWMKSRGWRDNSGYQTYDARGSVSHDWTDRLTSGIGAYYNWSDYDLPGYLTKKRMEQDPRKATTMRDGGRMESWGADLNTVGDWRDAGELSLDVSLQRRLRSTRMWSWYQYGRYAVNSLAVSPKYQLDTEIGRFRDKLTVGIDFTADRLEYDRYAYPAYTHNGHADLYRYGGAVYAQNEFFFTDELSLQVGLRGETLRTAVDGYDYATRLLNGKTDWEWAADVALLFRPTDKQKYFVRGSTLYRYPFLDEIAMYQGYNTGFDSDLDPETGWNVEAGTELEVFDQVNWNLRVYRLAMQDEIAYNGRKNVNMDETTRYGLETGLRWNPVNWGTFGAEYELVDARFADGRYEDDEVPLVPRQRLTLDAEIKIAYGFSLLGDARLVDRQYMGEDYDNQADKLTEYAVFDGGIKYEPTFVKRLSIIAACDNIFDRRYATSAYDYGSAAYNAYYPCDGRTFRLTVSYTF